MARTQPQQTTSNHAGVDLVDVGAVAAPPTATPRFSMRIEADPKGALQKIGPAAGDEANWRNRLHATFGTVGDAFALTELDRLINACKLSDGSVDPIRINAVLAAIDGVKPRNELEAMLAAEIAITHGLVIDFLHKTKRAQYLPQLEAQGRLAAKLMRALAGHVELLAKLQRGGEQTVRVEHVHVHAGGQAVVGHVAVGGGG